MTQRKVRFLLLGIFGGLGVIYLIVSAVMGVMTYTLSPSELAAIDGDPEAFPILFGVFGILGAAFLCAGAGCFIGMTRAEKRREELFLYGSVVEGVVEELRCNYAVKVNRYHPWYVYVRCRHPLTREEVTVRSHSVFDPAVKAGDKVRVAFDPLDERRNAVELPERKVLQ